MKRLFVCAWLLAGPLAGAARAQEVVAVLGGDLTPYREAYAGFQEAFGARAPLLPLGAPIPKETKVVVTFGGKAAVQRYPGRVTLIYGIAPGLLVGTETHDGVSLKIRTEVEAENLLKGLVEIQPGLKRLAVLWLSDSFSTLAEKMVKAGASGSVRVLSEKVESGDELPAKLRGLKGKADAIWMPLDPVLLNQQNFETILQYSYDNNIPFYAPTEGLVEHGATAAVVVSYKDIGRAAAAQAKKALSGAELPPDVYVPRVEMSVNLSAAKKTGISIPSEILKKAVRVFP